MKSPIERAIALQKDYEELQRFDQCIDELQEFSTDQLHRPDKTNKWVEKLKANTQVSIIRRMQAIQKEMADLIREDKRAENIRLNKKEMAERRAEKSRKNQIPM